MEDYYAAESTQATTTTGGRQGKEAVYHDIILVGSAHAFWFWMLTYECQALPTAPRDTYGTE